MTEMTQLTFANYVLHRHWELYSLEAMLEDGWQHGWAVISWCHWFQNWLE